MSGYHIKYDGGYTDPYARQRLMEELGLLGGSNGHGFQDRRVEDDIHGDGQYTRIQHHKPGEDMTDGSRADGLGRAGNPGNRIQDKLQRKMQEKEEKLQNKFRDKVWGR